MKKRECFFRIIKNLASLHSSPHVLWWRLIGDVRIFFVNFGA